MSEEEIQETFQELELDKHNGIWGFNTPKQTLLTYNIIAWWNNKRLEITKIIGNKCNRYVVTHKGLDTSRFYIDRHYNDDLEHKNGKIKIIDFEII